MAPMSLLSCLLLVLVFAQGISAIDYLVVNNATGTPGGARFDREAGAAFARQKMAESTKFIWKIFRQDPATRKQGVMNITLLIEHLDWVAHQFNNVIHFSHEYIRDFKEGPLQPEVAGVIQHESTHVWQWNGNGKTPVGLIEGIADWVRLKAGLIPPHWVGPGKGDKWDMGYEYTARFLDYCNDLKDGFVAELNKRMKDDYSDNLFLELLGKSVDQLWKEYKAKYGSR